MQINDDGIVIPMLRLKWMAFLLLVFITPDITVGLRLHCNLLRRTGIHFMLQLLGIYNQRLDRDIVHDDIMQQSGRLEEWIVLKRV